MSHIAWLDTSVEDERRMREIVKMFSDTSTLDDLGIGQIRDALADLMFPGTSTIHTRARYFLLVPWIYRRAAEKHSGTMIATKAQSAERSLIEVLRTPSPAPGMIGAVAGSAVRNLPSAVYWSALQKYGILADAKNLRWDMPIPPPPDFPKRLDDGLDLTPEEAVWLREKIVRAAPASFYAFLLRHGLDFETTPHLWLHKALPSAPDHVRNVVEHARLFALTLNGATLIYNIMIAEKYDSATGNSHDYTTTYHDLFDQWCAELEEDRASLRQWDRSSFWTTVNQGRPLGRPVAPGARAFVDDWLDALASRGTNRLLVPGIRRMIADREHSNKGAQSRLRNDRLIRNWGGSSASARLAFRWPTVQNMLTDIGDGIARATAG